MSWHYYPMFPGANASNGLSVPVFSAEYQLLAEDGSPISAGAFTAESPIESVVTFEFARHHGGRSQYACLAVIEPSNLATVGSIVVTPTAEPAQWPGSIHWDVSLGISKELHQSVFDGFHEGWSVAGLGRPEPIVVMAGATSRVSSNYVSFHRLAFAAAYVLAAHPTRQTERIAAVCKNRFIAPNYPDRYVRPERHLRG